MKERGEVLHEARCRLIINSDSEPSALPATKRERRSWVTIRALRWSTPIARHANPTLTIMALAVRYISSKPRRGTCKNFGLRIINLLTRMCE